MAFLRFIFSSFWVWLGFVILLSIIGGGLVELVKTCKHNRRVTGYRVGMRWHIEVEDASREDVQQAIISTVYAQEGWEGNGEQDGTDENGPDAGGDYQA